MPHIAELRAFPDCTPAEPGDIAVTHWTRVFHVDLLRSDLSQDLPDVSSADTALIEELRHADIDVSN